jgi:polyisoprenoid-binding protein YceI
MKKIILSLMFSSLLFSANLVYKSGGVATHTEVFGDSSIDANSSNITSSLHVENDDISSLQGKVKISLIHLKSDNKERDEHMYKVLDTSKYTTATYTIENVKTVKNGYLIVGQLTLHGKTEPITLIGDIALHDDQLAIHAHTSFKMSQFGIEPPSLLFFTVRDLVDIKINTNYSLVD